MGAVHSKDARAILGDFHISGNVREISSDWSMEPGDTTVLTSTGRESIPGLVGGKISLGGPWDAVGTAGSFDAEVNGQIAAAAGEAVSFAPNGFALGSPVRSAVARETALVVAAKVTDPVDWKLELLDDGAIDRGLSLADLAAITVDTNGTGLDNAASSADGGAGVLHVTAYSGLTQVVFKVQHSTDNSAWADLVTFATVSARTSERKTAAGTVNRYLRAFADVTGTGSVTFQMSFCRR